MQGGGGSGGGGGGGGVDQDFQPEADGDAFPLPANATLPRAEHTAPGFIEPVYPLALYPEFNAHATAAAPEYPLAALNVSSQTDYPLALYPEFNAHATTAAPEPLHPEFTARDPPPNTTIFQNVERLDGWDFTSAPKALLVDALLSVIDKKELSNPMLVVFLDAALQMAGAGPRLTIPAIVAGIYALRKLPKVTMDDLWSVLGYTTPAGYNGQHVLYRRKKKRRTTGRRKR